MANKYYKNFVICGDIDYHCLLCKETFKQLVDVDKHIRWETHRKLVKTQTRFPKFKKDAVYKIGEYFYCETCNYLAPDMNAMNAHIGGESHQTIKQKPKTEAEVISTVCKRDSGYVIVCDVIIENRDWHGIVDRGCLICSADVYNVVKHVTTAEHVYNLIEARVVVESKDKFYRKVGKDSFYCFICKDAIPLSTLESHWTEKDHCEKKNDGSIYRITVSNSANENKKLELAKKLIQTQKDYFNIDFDAGSAVCKQCNEHLKLDFMTMLTHQKGHAGAPKEQPIIVIECPSSPEEEKDEVVYQAVQDHGKRRADMKKFGKENFIRLNAGASKGYCSLCHTTVSGSMRVFKEHVRGACHKGLLELKGIRKTREHDVPDAKSKPLPKYLTSIFLCRAVRILLLNKQHGIDIPSFIMASNVEKFPNCPMTKCYACDVYYERGQHLAHYDTEMHKKKFLAAKVLCVKGEFVREIRPDLYHCGYCNEVYPFWEVMEKHLRGWKHIQKKDDKNVLLKVTKEWFNDKVLTKPSNNPDILYLQFIGLGIF